MRVFAQNFAVFFMALASVACTNFDMRTIGLPPASVSSSNINVSATLDQSLLRISENDGGTSFSIEVRLDHPLPYDIDIPIEVIPTVEIDPQDISEWPSSVSITSGNIAGNTSITINDDTAVENEIESLEVRLLPAPRSIEDFGDNIPRIVQELIDEGHSLPQVEVNIEQTKTIEIQDNDNTVEMSSIVTVVNESATTQQLRLEVQLTKPAYNDTWIPVVLDTGLSTASSLDLDLTAFVPTGADLTQIFVPAGQTVATSDAFGVRDDGILETTESLFFRLGALDSRHQPGLNTIQQFDITDGAPTVNIVTSFVGGDILTSEDMSATLYTLTVSLNQPTPFDVVLPLQVQAASGDLSLTDFQGASFPTSVTILAGQTIGSTSTFQIEDDALAEGLEEFTVEFGALPPGFSTASTKRIAVTDNDIVLSFPVNTLSITEHPMNFPPTVSLTLGAPAERDLTINVQRVAAGSTADVADLDGGLFSITILAGTTTGTSAPLQGFADGVVEGPENLLLEFVRPDPASWQLGANPQIDINIHDVTAMIIGPRAAVTNDTTPTVTWDSFCSSCDVNVSYRLIVTNDIVSNDDCMNSIVYDNAAAGNQLGRTYNQEVSALAVGQYQACLIKTDNTSGISGPALNNPYRFDIGNQDCASLSGSGTGADPYLIQNTADFNQIRFCADENHTFSITSALDFGNNPFDPIGHPLDVQGGHDRFRGIINGNGNLISNLQPGVAMFTSAYFIHPVSQNGIFGRTFNATMDNFQLDTVQVSGNIENGSLVGYADQSLLSNIQYTNVQPSAVANFGGLVGIAFGTTLQNITGTVNLSGSQYMGGVAYRMTSSAVMDSVNVTGSVQGNASAGGLVNTNYASMIQNSSFNGSVTGDCFVGGLAARSVTGSFDSSHVTGNINSLGSCSLSSIDSTETPTFPSDRADEKDLAGGIVGHGEGTSISLCSSTADIEGDFGNIGGLAGSLVHEWNPTATLITATSSVSESFSTGNITYRGDAFHGQNLGGLVGFAEADISNSYASGNITSDLASVMVNTGGLVGQKYLDGTISETYANGFIDCGGTPDPSCHGFVGEDNGSLLANANHWDMDISGSAAPRTGATAQTSAQMNLQATYVGWDFLTPIWTIVDGVSPPTLVNNP